MEKRDVVCFLIKKENKFLLQKRDAHYKNFPNQWSFFGGAIEAGENPEKAAVRELYEEIGIKADNLKQVYTGEYKNKQHHGTFYIFEINFNFNVSEIRLGEGEGFAFFSRQEIENLNIIEEDKKILMRLI